MQQINIKVDFKNVQPFPDLNVDWDTLSTWAKNPDNIDLLKRWICTCYYLEECEYYQGLINVAIRANNLLAVETRARQNFLPHSE